MSIKCVTSCSNVVEANMLKDRLELEGIESFLTNENFTTLMPQFNGIMGGGIQIMVEEKDLPKAQQLLNCSEASKILCPQCHSDNLTYGLGANRIKKIVAILLLCLSGNPLGNIKGSYRCNDCGCNFKG